MTHKILMRVIFAVFVLGIIGAILYFRSSIIPTSFVPPNIIKSETKITPSPVKKTATTQKKTVQETIATDRVQELESQMSDLEDEISEQNKELKKLSDKISSQSTTGPLSTSGKNIITTAYTQGSSFTTSSPIYSPMGMYVNVTCPVKCVLWIHFYTTSKNTAIPNSAQGYSHMFGLFINDAESSVYTQGSFPIANASFPSSLNAAIPVNAGTHTVDIRGKTTGGTLSVEKSFLQVIAIEE